jgi:hypothetical protein
MKMRCWACAILGLVLFYSYARAEEKADAATPPVIKKGSVVKVGEKDIVVKADDKKVGEVTYSLAQVAADVTLDEDVQKKINADQKTRGKYFAAPSLKTAELQPGTEVSVEKSEQTYRIKVLKLPEHKK